MTDAQLQGIAAQALNLAKRDLERHRFNFLLAAYHECDEKKLYRMSEVEALLIERLGESWLNHGKTKDIGFQLLRLAVDTLPPDAVVFAFACNSFKPTPKLQAMTRAQQVELIKAGHDRHNQAVKEGLMSVCDALTVTVQTPERVCLYRQNMDRHHEPEGKPDTLFFPQAEFGGRLKMYGAKSDAVSQ